PELTGGYEKGVELDILQELRTECLTTYDWEAASRIEPHFTSVLEGLTVHFIHEKLEDQKAIPLIMIHAHPATVNGTNVSFHVVVASLPGFTFSSAPPANWTTSDTARIFNTLITKVLGYCAVHSTDWGRAVGYTLYNNDNDVVRAAHFGFIPMLPPSAQDIAANNITLSDDEQVAEQRTSEFSLFLRANYEAQRYRLTLHDSPVDQLAWIGAKVKICLHPTVSYPINCAASVKVS
ncbi:Alpha/Beta hydrolase protein, partial [Mycena alexandri]